ncbi:hypothetical protein ACQCVP_02830 [Rossellomorea vietnamensis]
MFPGEKKAGFPFIPRGLFDPVGLGAGAGFIKSGKAPLSGVRTVPAPHEIKESRITK